MGPACASERRGHNFRHNLRERDPYPPTPHGDDGLGFQVLPVALQDLCEQGGTLVGGDIGQPYDTAMARPFCEHKLPKVGIDRDENTFLARGPAQDGTIARVFATFTRFDDIVPLRAQPVGETATGTTIDEKLHLLAVCTASRESCAITACA